MCLTLVQILVRGSGRTWHCYDPATNDNILSIWFSISLVLLLTADIVLQSWINILPLDIRHVECNKLKMYFPHTIYKQLFQNSIISSNRFRLKISWKSLAHSSVSHWACITSSWVSQWVSDSCSFRHFGSLGHNHSENKVSNPFLSPLVLSYAHRGSARHVF